MSMIGSHPHHRHPHPRPPYERPAIFKANLSDLTIKPYRRRDYWGARCHKRWCWRLAAPLQNWCSRHLEEREARRQEFMDKLGDAAMDVKGLSIGLKQADDD